MEIQTFFPSVRYKLQPIGPIPFCFCRLFMSQTFLCPQLQGGISICPCPFVSPGEQEGISWILHVGNIKFYSFASLVLTFQLGTNNWGIPNKCPLIGMSICPSENFVTKVEKQGYLCPVQTFLVSKTLIYNRKSQKVAK